MAKYSMLSKLRQHFLFFASSSDVLFCSSSVTRLRQLNGPTQRLERRRELQENFLTVGRDRHLKTEPFFMSSMSVDCLVITSADLHVLLFHSHINKKTTYTDPRLAFAVEDNDSPDDFTQKFDSSSTALQVLHGRDLSGKVVIVTGGNSGIGYETCRALAFHGAQVIMASRDLDKSKAAVERIVSERVSNPLRSDTFQNLRSFR